MRYSEKLRVMADYLEAHPLLDEKLGGRFDYPYASIYCPSEKWEEFQVVAKAMGSYDKSGSNGLLTATHRETNDDGDYVFTVQVQVAGVCEATPKLDESGTPITRPVRKYIETGETETVMEYNCPTSWANVE